jgi:hypothetical protein
MQVAVLHILKDMWWHAWLDRKSDYVYYASHSHAAIRCSALQVIAKSAVASAVAQEVIRLGKSNVFQLRVANRDTVVSDIHIPEGTTIWIFPNQVRVPVCASQAAQLIFLVLREAGEHSKLPHIYHASRSVAMQGKLGSTFSNTWHMSAGIFGQRTLHAHQLVRLVLFMHAMELDWNAIIGHAIIVHRLG